MSRPSIFAGRSRPPKCSGGPFSRGHGGPFSCCRYQSERPSVAAAQRRPGREPRRHPRAAGRRRSRRDPLNEGRGANPGDTARRLGRTPAESGSLNEGRGANPGDTANASEHHRSRSPTLNEGRGANPGDTSLTPLTSDCDPTAQRRPGREPRRHPPRPAGRFAAAVRSTKAGARTPATRGCAPTGRSRRRSLNEGRGANPGDTRVMPDADGRAITAQRRPGREPRRHQVPREGWGRGSAALNEGRGANPGDTRIAGSCAAGMSHAQRRPGREPRRHLGASPVRRCRSAYAQRRPGREPRRHLEARRRRRPEAVRRSTKAGARTPATPEGDPSAIGECRRAQRRPGREPRRHARRRRR